MTALRRTALAMLVLAALGVPAGAWVDSLVHEDGVERLKPPDTAEVRAAVAALPEARRETTEVKRLLRAADRADAYAVAEVRWGEVVAGVLTEAQRRDGVARADGKVPEDQAPSGDRPGDAAMTALARLLLDRYGYAEVELPGKTSDAWTGVDRQKRASAVRALVDAGELSPAQAHVILRATLELLRAEQEHGAATRELARGVVGLAG